MATKKERYKAFHADKDNRIKAIQGIRYEPDPKIVFENDKTIRRFFVMQRRLNDPASNPTK